MSTVVDDDSHVSWSACGRFFFRFAACYLLLSWFTVYGVLTVIPGIGYKLEGWVDPLWQSPVLWLGQRVFHLTGFAAQAHASDSRDTALDWIAAGLVIVVAWAASIVWTALDQRRSNYRTAMVWLRFVFRLALIFLMLRYALMKVFPLQMPPPSLPVLNEPVGNLSPMTLLWTLIGLHPAYEVIAGLIEAAAAVLLCFRRTALLGACLTVVIMTNVLLYNLFSNVPVKLGALNVLLLALALLVPDVPSLYRFLVAHKVAKLTSSWVPAVTSRRGRLLFAIAEALFVCSALVQFLPPFWSAWSQQRTLARHPSPVSGVWRVDSANRLQDGRLVSLPVLTGEGVPMVALSLEPNGLAMARSADGKLWRAAAQIDDVKHTLTLDSGYFDGVRFSAKYQMTQPDPNHLILVPSRAAAGTNGTLQMTRVASSGHYPLLDEKFHWINEWAVER